MTSMANASNLQQAVTELSTFLIPVTHKYLLLPNVSIAEIIVHRLPQPMDNVPTWFMGHLDWRTRQIPLVSFEGLNDEPFQASSGQRNCNIAVLNGIGTSEQLPFLALLTQSAPRMMRVSAEELAVDNQAELGPAELMVVSANGELASIPNLEFIENTILQFAATA